MSYTKHVISSLPLLAKVLGDQHKVSVTIGGKEAFTNGNTVNIPALPLDSDTETLALVRGFIDHEAGGHLRFTDFNSLRTAKLSSLEHFLWNSIEDWRVENALCELYPGCRGNLDWLIKKFFADGDKNRSKNKQNSPETSVMNYILLTIRSWDVPEIAASAAAERAIVEANFPGLISDIDVALLQVRAHCPSTQAAIDHAKAIARLILDWRRDANNVDTQSPNSMDNWEDGESDGDSGSENGSSNSSQAPDATANRTQKRTEPDATGGDSSADADTTNADANTDADTTPPQSATSGKTQIRISSKQLPKTFGELIADGLGTASANATEETKIAVAKVCKVAVPVLPESEIQSARTITTALRCKLQGALQTQTLERVATGRHGRLHTPALHRVFCQNPRVFHKNGNVIRTDTAIHILVDASGSMMGSSIELAKKACFSLAMALAPLPGVNVAVTAFPAPIALNVSVRPILDHGQAMHNRFDFQAGGSTPLTEALLWTTQQLIVQPEPRKIILLLTDGVPDNENTALQCIQEATHAGIEIYGLGIYYELIHRFLPKTSVTILKLEDLPKALFSLAQQILTHGR